MAITYSCPMHPEVRQDHPGLCSLCGMKLIQMSDIGSRKSDQASLKSDIRHPKSDKHAGHSLAMFAQKFWVSLVLTIPVLVYSDLPERLLGVHAPAFPGSQYLPLAFSSIVFFYGGWVFLQGAVRELRARQPGMMTLIGLAISVAYLYSVFVTLLGTGETLFWELTTLITVMLLGHWLEMRAVQGARGALQELSKLLPDTAEVVVGKTTKIVPLGQLRVGDVVMLRPGGKVPADGLVVSGSSHVDESLATGESKPVAKTVANKVIAGTINGDGSLKVRVTHMGEQTFLAGVMRLVAQAQVSKSRLQLLSDQAAYYLTVVALSSGVITLVAWFVTTLDPATAVERAVAVLVIACPHALGLAIPLVASISTTKAARAGVLVRDRLALEAARSVDVVLFDKTGTLTKGEYGVDTILPNVKTQISNVKLLQLAASVDAHSEHFIAKAVLSEAKKRRLAVAEVKNFQRLPGKGVSGTVAGQTVFVGSEAIVANAKMDVPDDLQPTITKLAKQGKTIIYIIVGGQFAGAIALADQIRPESRQAIQQLKVMGIDVAMITGDSQEVAAWVAQRLGIKEFFARVLPDQKSEKVKLLQQRNKKVAMVGDGINDAPALTQADVGIAIGAGTNVAIESAGIILVKNDPRDIAKIIRLSQATYGKMVQNLFWATGYNIIALPLAAGVLASKGIILQPALSALFMSLSTVIVAINAMLLKNQKIA